MRFWFVIVGALVLVMGLGAGEVKDSQSLPAPSWMDEAQKRDWKTASYGELKAWAEQLGLNDTGTADDLRTRLGQSLGFTDLTPAPKVEKKKKILTIESARSAGFLQVDRTDGGRELHLSGGVHLIFKDNTKNVTHDIVCSELWYDQALGEMTAKGHVVYTLINGSSRDVFHGDSLTFRLSDAQGIFYGGSSTRQQTEQGVTLTFTYQGKTIKRSGNDVVVMDNGTITSSPARPPNYELKASKIWILAPGEWGIENAVLWLGRIPVFYFPFYFQPGDDFFFNPVLGFPGPSDPRGTYLQTTTYFLGQKKRDDSAMSFLQVAGSGGSVKRVQRGLFMVPGTPPPQPDNWILKTTNDLYTNLGYLNGVYAEMPGLAGLKTFNWWTTLGVTRTLDATGNPYQTAPFQPLLSPWSQFQWDQGYFGPWSFPLRWGAHLDASNSLFTFKAEFYTDPSLYGQAFLNRSENFSLTTLLGLNTNTNTYTLPTIQSSLNWQLALTPQSLSFPWLFLNTLSLTRLEADAEWDQKSNGAYTSYSTSPSAYLYAPSLFTIPSISFSTGGKLLDFSGTPAAPVTVKSALISPWASASSPAFSTNTEVSSSADATDTSKTTPTSALILPDLQPDLTIDKTVSGSTGSLSWTYSPTWRNETRFDTTQWVQPGQMNWAVQTQQWFLNQTADVNYQQSSLDKTWSLSEDVNLSQLGQKTWVLGSGLTPQQVLLDQQTDASNTQIQVYQTFSPTVNPLVSIPALAQSNVTYNLKSRLWSHSFSSWDSNSNTAVYQDLYWDGTADSVPINNVSAKLNWVLLYPNPAFNSYLSWSNDLDPRPTNQSLSWNFAATQDWGSLTSTLTYRDIGNGWNPDPWVANVTWKPFTNFSFSQDYTYDLVDEKPQSAISTLSLWGFQTKYTAQQTFPYSFNTVSKSWTQGTQMDFLDSELDFTWNNTWKSPYFWKGRAYTSLGLNASWLINLQQYTQMPLSVSYTFNLAVSRFLDISLTHTFTNNLMYMYFPGIVQSFGVPGLATRNFFTDVANSLELWNPSALQLGAFKASSIALNLTHYMDDWQIQLNYQASPQIPVGSTQYQWVSTLTFLIQWYPFPQVKANVQQDSTGQWSIQNPQTPGVPYTYTGS